ncbi:unnamed protein product [Medioppia subpectinata]|uniref:Fatty acid synthase n=1 Tax=Medioppia subpectinata TaxID=1979941 RepID=A0A7R9Q0A9_9ACAR|nr:unnamed protein product [Medioppia subpectinata]CAG2107868.1 unnamed protein product [Medioppia subpectinata]
METESECVRGYIRVVANNDIVLLAQNKLNGIEHRFSHCEYRLERDDIYKDLRILGLDYGPEFQRLRRVATNDFNEMYGLCEWDGNFVTFLDSMFHSVYLSVSYQPGGEVFRYIFQMDTNTDTNIDFNTKPYSDILANDLIANVIKGAKVGTYRHLKLPNDYDKCLSNDYYLNMRQTRRIPMGPEKLYPDCLFGFEYVGRRADTGQRVMGLEFGRMFCTSGNVVDKYMTAIPEHWSMAEVVTVLSTYSTVHYGLIKRANLKKGESVLIHSAAGGVGQAAINVCKHYECNIYATVGSEEKKQFLINEYNIPEKRIFSSRDILFKNEIMDATDGQGVDVVLNSLTGERLSAGLECLAISGRFVEIGKYDMFFKNQLAINDSIRDIQFIRVFLDYVIMNDIHYLNEFYDWMHKNCTNGCVKPLNYTVFEAKDADKAFRYMTSGEHIGKVIVKMRDEEIERTALTFIKPVPKLLVSVKTYFNANKVYIITGGLGGFGLELIPWMQSLGARKFVVTSRSGLKTDYQKFIVNRFVKKSQNKKYFASDLMVSTANGLTIEGTKQLLNEAKELAPIGGILANLDQMTRQLDYKLDYFVVFSSISCGKGSPGQSNYGFGNSLCERICEERRRDGLHGLAVQYGPIGDVGVFESTSNKASTVGIDPKCTPNDTTLGDIGLDSMFAVELQQELNLIEFKVLAEMRPQINFHISFHDSDDRYRDVCVYVNTKNNLHVYKI